MAILDIPKETVAAASSTLPDPFYARCDVANVEVRTRDGKRAIVEFQRLWVRRPDNTRRLEWNAVTCWRI